MFDADKLLILVSSTLIICYVSGLFYVKTKVPDIVWAILFGIILGPILGLFEKDLFTSLSALMSTVALIIILLDAGINLNITLLKEATVKASLLSSVTILAVMFSVGISLSFLVPSSFTLLEGMLVGSMIGGTSTIAVYGILNGLEKIFTNIESSRTILTLESVISDPICIIASITLIKIIMTPETSLTTSVLDMISIFILSSVLGFSIGIFWSEVLQMLRGRPLTYIMTIALLSPIYIVTNRVIGEGGGPIAVLIFGLIISNYNLVMTKLNVKRQVEIDILKIREFHEEITFFIKSFFFVYVGLIATLSVDYLLIGLGILALILILRYAIVSTLGKILKFTQTEKVLTRIIYASGLPAFVMSQLPSIYDPNQQYFTRPEIYPNITLPLVLFNILFAALVGPVVAKRQLKTV